MPRGIGIKHGIQIPQGTAFGKWRVVGEPQKKRGHALWFPCKCACDRTEKLVTSASLRAGTSTRCRLCADEANALRQAQYGSAFRQLLGRYKASARQRDLPWALTGEQFRTLTSSPCFYTGRLPSAVIVSLGGDRYQYNGVDRLDSRVGYTIANCVPCCAAANIAKNTLSFDEFSALIKEICCQLESNSPKG